MGQKIKHPFFGELDSDYIADLRCWDFSFSFQGQKIDVALWEFKGGKGINKKTLYLFSRFL